MPVRSSCTRLEVCGRMLKMSLWSPGEKLVTEAQIWGVY